MVFQQAGLAYLPQGACRVHSLATVRGMKWWCCISTYQAACSFKPWLTLHHTNLPPVLAWQVDNLSHGTLLADSSTIQLGMNITFDLPDYETDNLHALQEALTGPSPPDVLIMNSGIWFHDSHKQHLKHNRTARREVVSRHFKVQCNSWLQA